LVALSPAELGVAGRVQVDVQVLLFGLAVSTAAGIVFGLAPARQSLRTDLHQDLKQTARGATNARQRRVRALLLTSEVALSLVLLVAAGLTIKSLVTRQRVSPGFDPARVVISAVSLPAARYQTPERKADFWERSLESLRAIPGVEIAGAVSRLPIGAGN